MSYSNVLRVNPLALAVVLGAASFTASAVAAPCLSTPTDAVGAPVFGATVQTFIDLGITPGNGR